MESGTNWNQIGNITLPKLANFMQKKDIYVNNLESVSLAYKCVFYRLENNAKGVGGPQGTEF